MSNKKCDYIPAHKNFYSDDYDKSNPSIELVHRDNPRVIAGYASRSGITHPFHVTRATYQMCVGSFSVLWRGREVVGGVWVFENGEFIDSQEWHADMNNVLPRNREVWAMMQEART